MNKNQLKFRLKTKNKTMKYFKEINGKYNLNIIFKL